MKEKATCDIGDGRTTTFEYFNRLNLPDAVKRLDVLMVLDSRTPEQQREFDSLLSRMANADLTLNQARAKINGGD